MTCPVTYAVYVQTRNTAGEPEVQHNDDVDEEAEDGDDDDESSSNSDTSDDENDTDEPPMATVRCSQS